MAKMLTEPKAALDGPFSEIYSRHLAVSLECLLAPIGRKYV